MAGTIALGMSSCIEQIDPQSSTVTVEQAGNAPGSFDNFVAGLTNSLCGSFVYSGSSQTPYDYGYPSFFLMRDVMGQDIALDWDGDWYQAWYTCSVGLGPHYAVCQYPMTYFFGWIKDCNTVITMGGDKPNDLKKNGVGIAYAMRAMYYLDMVQMFAQEPYAANPEALTVPLRSHTNTSEMHVARMTNKEAYAFILSDLDKAEQYLADYKRADIYTPDVTVVYGLKARAYLLMEDWANAEKYAKLAQEGYTMTTNDQYTDRNNGFNTPTGSWMFACQFKPTDDNITQNDGDGSWGTHMIVEVYKSGMGYAANYGSPKRMDAHLYSTIPATDCRKKCYIDPSLDEMEEEDALTALAAYTDVPEDVLATGWGTTEAKCLGCLELKFRPKNGEHVNQYAAYCVSVPMMRMEEMMLIEAEAAGMQDLARGKALLETFGKVRDANYKVDVNIDGIQTTPHGREAYYNESTGAFRNEVWWQRRVELWGEGFATYDIKRLQKGIIRSYAGTNHVADYRWNMTTVPQWMTYCFVQTESNYNNKLVQNPTPHHDNGDDEAFVW